MDSTGSYNYSHNLLPQLQRCPTLQASRSSYDHTIKMSKENKDLEDLVPVQTTDNGQMLDGRRHSIRDAVFGEVTESGPNYRNVSTPEYHRQ